MRRAKVYHNGLLAGILTQNNLKSYEFQYDDAWFSNDALPSVSLTLPKSRNVHKSDHLFPFFFKKIKRSRLLPLLFFSTWPANSAE